MNRQPKLLVILTPAFPATTAEANWVPSQQIFLRSVKKLSPEIKIIVLSFIYPENKKTYKWNGIDVIPFNGNRYKKFKRFLLWRSIWEKLNSLKKKENISAILSFWCGECALVGHYFSKRNGITHKIWISGQDARKDNKLVKLIRPSPNELVAKSDFLIDEFYKNHNIKPGHLIPNGIDLSMYSKTSFTRDIDVIGSGSLNTLKQYDIFIEVIAELKKAMPGIKAILCGDGDQYEKIETMRQQFSLQENIELAGMTKPADTIQLMQRSKILLHTSSYEGFSMACYEALYAGAHVISFVKTMYHEIKNWHVVNTKAEMIKKSHELLSDPTTLYEPVFTYSMDDSAAEMINLLGLAE